MEYSASLVGLHRLAAGERLGKANGVFGCDSASCGRYCDCPIALRSPRTLCSLWCSLWTGRRRLHTPSTWESRGCYTLTLWFGTPFWKATGRCLTVSEPLAVWTRRGGCRRVVERFKKKTPPKGETPPPGVGY